MQLEGFLFMGWWITCWCRVVSAANARVRKQTELEKRKAAVMKLVGMLTSMFRRRHFYEVLPMDPVAWPLLLAAHREALRTSMAEHAGLHRIDASTMLPPAAKACPLTNCVSRP